MTENYPLGIIKGIPSTKDAVILAIAERPIMVTDFPKTKIQALNIVIRQSLSLKQPMTGSKIFPFFHLKKFLTFRVVQWNPLLTSCPNSRSAFRWSPLRISCPNSPEAVETSSKLLRNFLLDSWHMLRPDSFWDDVFSMTDTTNVESSARRDMIPLSILRVYSEGPFPFGAMRSRLSPLKEFFFLLTLSVSLSLTPEWWLSSCSSCSSFVCQNSVCSFEVVLLWRVSVWHLQFFGRLFVHFFRN